MCISLSSSSSLATENVIVVVVVGYSGSRRGSRSPLGGGVFNVIVIAAKNVVIIVVVRCSGRCKNVIVVVVVGYSGSRRGSRNPLGSSGNFQSIFYITVRFRKVFEGEMADKVFAFLENLFLEVLTSLGTNEAFRECSIEVLLSSMNPPLPK